MKAVQIIVVCTGSGMLTNLVINDIMPWWGATLIILWAFAIGLIAFMQGMRA